MTTQTVLNNCGWYLEEELERVQALLAALLIWNGMGEDLAKQTMEMLPYAGCLVTENPRTFGGGKKCGGGSLGYVREVENVCEKLHESLAWIIGFSLVLQAREKREREGDYDQ